MSKTNAGIIIIAGVILLFIIFLFLQTIEGLLSNFGII